MSEKKDPNQSTPGALRRRMQEAHESGQPMHVERDEVTGVIDIAIGEMRDNTAKAIAKVHELCRRLDSSTPPPPPKPV